MGVLMLAGVLFLSRQGAVLVSNMKQAQAQQKVVVIDAGHGGADPGKVGVSGTLEKDINLKIAFQLKEFLEENDIKVVMTRDSDCLLYTSGKMLCSFRIPLKSHPRSLPGHRSDSRCPDYDNTDSAWGIPGKR